MRGAGLRTCTWFLSPHPDGCRRRCQYSQKTCQDEGSVQTNLSGVSRDLSDLISRRSATIALLALGQNFSFSRPITPGES